MNIDIFPLQGGSLSKRVEVCFNDDTCKPISGTIVRYDMADPWLTIIKLDNDRFILGSECQYKVID